MNQSKFIQITSSIDQKRGIAFIYALDDSGVVWQYNEDGWEALHLKTREKDD